MQIMVIANVFCDMMCDARFSSQASPIYSGRGQLASRFALDLSDVWTFD